MESFFANRPIIKEIQRLSIFGVIDKYKNKMTSKLLNEIGLMKESIRFAGCSICLRLREEGILQEINNRLLKEQKV
ncbi:MAG: hypothetical protein AB1422_18965 [bacterium]